MALTCGCLYTSTKFNKEYLAYLKQATKDFYGEMRKMKRTSKIFALTLLTSLLLLLTLNCAFVAVEAQGNATVVVLDSLGGTVDPSGTTTYADGSAVTLTATPSDTTLYAFDHWIVSADVTTTTYTDNPLTITVTGGVTYAVQAVFSAVQQVPGTTGLPTNMATAAIIVVLTSAGGTTTPAPGTYALADATSTTLKATPNSGWVFYHWVISGPNLSHGGYPFTATPTDNPYTVDHGYGNRFVYQAVFVPTESTLPTPTPSSGGTLGGMSNETWIIIGLVVVIIIVLIAFGVYAARRKK